MRYTMEDYERDATKYKVASDVTDEDCQYNCHNCHLCMWWLGKYKEWMVGEVSLKPMLCRCPGCGEKVDS